MAEFPHESSWLGVDRGGLPAHPRAAHPRPPALPARYPFPLGRHPRRHRRGAGGVGLAQAASARTAAGIAIALGIPVGCHHRLVWGSGLAATGGGITTLPG